MKKYILSVLLLSTLVCGKAHAQWVVTDPTNFAGNIANTVKEIATAGKTVKNTLNGFKEVEKLYNQGKEYYDALKKVNNLVKDARKVQETVLLVGDISKMYVTNFKKMSQDPNFSSQELSAIANGYSKLLGESSKLLKDLQQIVNSSSLSMNDKERMDIIDKVHKEVKEYYNLVRYYTQKNISVSYLRAKKQNDAQKVLSLYGTELKYW